MASILLLGSVLPYGPDSSQVTKLDEKLAVFMSFTKVHTGPNTHSDQSFQQDLPTVPSDLANISHHKKNKTPMPYIMIWIHVPMGSGYTP